MLKSIFFLLLSVLPAKASALSLLNLETEARALALDNGIRLRFSTSTIDTFLNEGQRIMVTDTHAIMKASQFQLAVGTTYYSLPSDFMQMKRLSINLLIRTEITPESLDTKAGLNWQSSQAFPTSYFLNFSSRTMLGIYPVPNNSTSTGTVNYEYYAQAIDMVNSADVPFNAIVELFPYHHTLAYWAAARMAAIDGRLDLASYYTQIFMEGEDRMRREANFRPSYNPNAMPTSASNRSGP